ncbi:MAG: hypothetical protein ABI612_13320 [Betaproteobacteria bacterium]
MNDDMNNDTSRHDVPQHDNNIRDAVTWQDTTTYSMSLPQVYARFVAAGLDRSLRTLQRYCEHGHLRAAKYPTETGAVWYVDPASVETKIEEIRQVQEAALHRSAAPSPVTPPPTGYDQSRPSADRRELLSTDIKDDSPDVAAATNNDDLRPANSDAVRRANDSNTNGSDNRDRQATTDSDSRYVTVPVVIIDALTAQLAAKDEQIKRRDEQMERLVVAHDKDRQLLGAALSIIHREDFPMELGKWDEFAAPSESAPAEELKPDFEHGRGHPQPPHQGDGL